MNRILSLCFGCITLLVVPSFAKAEDCILEIHNFVAKEVRVVVCSANATEKRDLDPCTTDGKEDKWKLQVSPGQKVISTFDKQGRLLATFPVNVSKPHSHLNSILIYNGSTWKPARDNSGHKGAPPDSFCNGFDDKEDCRP